MSWKPLGLQCSLQSVTKFEFTALALQEWGQCVEPLDIANLLQLLSRTRVYGHQDSG